MNRMFHYCLLSFVFHRIFLKELENCIENPELLAQCFLKRVSKSFSKFVWISMFLSNNSYRLTFILSLWLFMWMRETHISRYSQCVFWNLSLLTGGKRSVSSVLQMYFKLWSEKKKKDQNVNFHIRLRYDAQNLMYTWHHTAVNKQEMI